MIFSRALLGTDKDKNDYNSMKLMVKWLRTSFAMGYYASESKINGEIK